MRYGDRVTVLTESAITLWHFPETRIVAHELDRYPGVATLEQVLQQGIELMTGAPYGWLSDDRRGGALPRAHHIWAETVWGPRAVAAGWTHWALVPPTEMLGSKNMARVVEIYGRLGVECSLFDSPAAGLAWLSRALQA